MILVRVHVFFMFYLNLPLAKSVVPIFNMHVFGTENKVVKCRRLNVTGLEVI